jgi:hypothetical protein
MGGFVISVEVKIVYDGSVHAANGSDTETDH